MKTVVLFGGTGFIGTHLAEHLLQYCHADRIYLVDLNEPRKSPYTPLREAGLKSGNVVFVKHDVRKLVPPGMLPEKADIIFNLAAVHREPGHLAHEYFETNLTGAENVCAWASTAGCEMLVFTSSISPYGPSEEKRTESSIPAPATPYGSSKLGAEKIHMDWRGACAGRRLLILRPGVVFGAGEGGNVTRLVRSLVKGYFVYLGNRRTIKAAGYVKELCLATMFGLEEIRKADPPELLINFTMDPPPTVEDMVNAILRTIGKARKPFSVPPRLLLGLSYALFQVERLVGIKVPINPVRVRKLIRSNSVWAEQLKSLGYQYKYTLESAFDDWKRDLPEDFSA
jgi:nucleoside-diphosphate-sugar epimerase